MNLREERGKAIAATGTIKQSDKELVYIVPSQNSQKSYKVDLTGEDPTCNCPDFEERGKACKHVFAVAFTVVHKQNIDGSTTTTQTLTLTETRETYPQNWKAYTGSFSLTWYCLQRCACWCSGGCPWRKTDW
jgi:uncharacterized Zn finger protein